MIKIFHGSLIASKEDAEALHRISNYLHGNSFRIAIELDPELENEEDEQVLKDFFLASLVALKRLIDEGRVQ